MTIKEIAAAAGVSIGTVDRVIHGRSRVAAETRERIERLIAEAGFTPNALASELRRDSVTILGVVTPLAAEDSGYWRLAHEGLKNARELFSRYKVEVRLYEFPRDEPGGAVHALQRATRDGLSGVLAAPIDPGAIQQVLETGVTALPYVCFDGDPAGLNALSLVAQDPLQNGRLAARMLSTLAKGPSRVVLMNPHPHDLHLARRVEGARDWLREHRPDIEDVTVVEESGIEACRDRIAAMREHIDALYVCNAAGARVAELWRGKDSRPGIVGCDLVPDNIAALEEGRMDFIISQRPELQLREGLRLLFRHIVLREDVPTRIRAPLDIYVRENLPEPAAAQPDL